MFVLSCFLLVDCWLRVRLIFFANENMVFVYFYLLICFLFVKIESICNKKIIILFQYV